MRMSAITHLTSPCNDCVLMLNTVLEVFHAGHVDPVNVECSTANLIEFDATEYSYLIRIQNL